MMPLTDGLSFKELNGMAGAEKLLVTLDSGIKRITINRPERRNSVDLETAQRLLAAVKDGKFRRPCCI
jgi:enoyl-CoA hydratase/carnithine racemase